MNQTSEIEKTFVKDAYENLGEHFYHTRQYHWSWIREFVDDIPHESNILDIGCGTGRNMKIKTNYNHKFKGIDMCKSFVDICKSQKLDVIQGNMKKLPYEDDSFEYIMNIACFHHLSDERGRIQALQEMKRIIKPGGKILLSVWSITQPEKTRRIFESYGDTFVSWKKHNGDVIDRYYYIFGIDEICRLFEFVGLHIVTHFWDCGNEIYVLSKHPEKE